jgi:type I restriction-modification system DNA methylase subunit
LAAADILRGSLDPDDYRQLIMTLLFINRLNDTFEENVDKQLRGYESILYYSPYYNNKENI